MNSNSIHISDESGPVNSVFGLSLKFPKPTFKHSITLCGSLLPRKRSDSNTFQSIIHHVQALPIFVTLFNSLIKH